MYETIKMVNGYEIYRMTGTRKCYWININENVRKNFSTIKSAVEWAKVH